MKKKTLIRFLGPLLCCAMVLGCFPAVSFAAKDDSLCQHHPVHTAACGYGSDSVCTFPCTACGAYADDSFPAACSMDSEVYASSEDAGDGNVVAGGSCGEALTYVLTNDGVLTISGTGAMANYDYREGVYTPWYEERENITSVVLQEGVTSIGVFAFHECSNLTSVTLPKSLQFFMYGAFQFCSSLTDITIPDGMTGIGYATFAGCSSLTHVTIPESVTSIDVGAFRFCSNLESVTLPKNLTFIGRSAFYLCSSLTDINLPDGLSSIGGSAFAACSSLTSITIPDSVTFMEGSVFQECTSLTSVTLPAGVTSVDSYAFCGCTSLTDITIPERITAVGDYAFGACSSLTNVHFGGTKADWDAIVMADGNDSLKNANIIFRNPCAQMKLSLPKGTTVVDNSAFADCITLESVLIPQSITGIGSMAFDGCTSLDVISFCGSAPTIAADAFAGVTAVVYYPENDRTWTSGIMQNYGGTLTWVPYAVE